MILHTDTALLKHRPAHLQPPSQVERAAARQVTRHRILTSGLVSRLSRFFTFWHGMKVS